MDAAGGILVILALGLILRLIIAYLLPGSGFKVDLESFRFWADNLAAEGLNGFYVRDFFHDYTPGYLYVLWLVGMVGSVLGDTGDLIKVPPILADLALGYLAWSMTRELGGSERSARLAGLLVILNPITWLDSVVWGQVDSVGVVFLLLSLRELWRDRPERSAILATVAAIIKPQLGILIPIVAIVVIRRALRPKGGFGDEPEPEPLPTTIGLERRVRGPLRIVTTGLAGFLTALILSWPFGLSMPGLVAQIFSTAAGYPYVTVNAFNPWALVTHVTADGSEEGLALNRQWVCDSTILATPPSDFQIGPFLIPELANAGSTTDRCPDGMMIGAFPAALVGAVLFLLVAGLTVWQVARRPDRRTMLVALAVLSLAFFVLPTRVHERYLFPLVAIGSILAAVSIRWRIAYALSSLATIANMYVVLTTYYGNNPSITDWLGIGDVLASYWGVAVASVSQAVVLGWAFFQLRSEATEGLAEDIARSAADEDADADRLDDWDPHGDPDLGQEPPAGRWQGPTREIPRWASAVAKKPSTGAAGSPAFGAGAAVGGSPEPGTVSPAWEATRDAGSLGPWAWVRARLGDAPVRADRTRQLNHEKGGRLDRLDLWVLTLLAISLLTVRMWRLDEPYQMHFDEVYHPRTATEFLQDWRYGQSQNIYEWTHPHLAKYAMAFGLAALGEDGVSATSRLGVAVTDAVVEPRRDDALDERRVEGDRLWVATGSEVRAYDLATRALAGTMALPDAIALAYDKGAQRLYVATRAGEIRIVETAELDTTRRGPPVEVASSAFLTIEAPVANLALSRDGERLMATLTPGFGSTEPTRSTVVVIDTSGALEMARPSFHDVAQISTATDGRIYVASSDGLGIIDPESGEVIQVFDVGGPAHGVVAINDVENDPIFVSIATPEGPKFVVVIAKSEEDPRIEHTQALPGATAGRAYFDLAARMVHMEGSVPPPRAGLGITSQAPVGSDTVYVIEPHGYAVYADAALPYVPVVMVMDENQSYPSTDREQLLAFDASGQVASVPIGRHAYAWRVPGVIAGVLMAVLLYILARLLFRRRSVAVILGLVVLVDGMLFVQSRIGMNDSYVGLGIVGAYTVFAALWLNPGDTRRHWLAFLLGMPLIGGFLGFALAAKWVAAFAIGGLGILVLARSALGRLLLIAGLVVITTVLGYIAISVPDGQSGGNYVFLGIMVALVVIAVLANVLHPVAWTWDEVRFSIGAPIVVGVLAILNGLQQGAAAKPIVVGPLSLSMLEIGLLAFIGAAVTWLGFIAFGRLGFGPFAATPEPDDPAAILEPPTAAPRGWLRLGSGFGLPALWLGLCLLVLPLGLYVASYLPWAFVENHQIVEGWPVGHTGQTLLQLTESMYNYHNDLPNPHPASSPWWAWTLDLKPVWFYEEGFAGGTSGSIYDSGNLVAWWLAIPAMAFVAYQAFKRRSAALAIIAIGFACQWISWSRIDRAAFQYHYYTALPFLLLALAYFLAELWHGTSKRIWLLARLAAGLAVMGPFLLWLLHRPLCAIVRVTDVNPDSQACPTLIPEVTITPRAIAIAVVVGVGVLLLLRELLSITDEDDPADLDEQRAAGGWRAALARIGLGGRWAVSVAIGAITTVGFLAVSTLLKDSDGLELTDIPVEPIALIVLLALSPVAAYVATARDSRRFVIGALAAMGFWFILWYPNISALPLPAAIHNAYQGFLPTYLYPFQFSVTNVRGNPQLLSLGPAIMLLAIAFMAIVIGYSAWSWRVALAERRRDLLAEPVEPVEPADPVEPPSAGPPQADPPPAVAGAD
ncbi:MAG TPA: phospholipid carrier-dependent glycosyltransferase [Candidatus Limnocylindria bacterium]|nr:phospholipid carrier-dependent glycosyltransferase [Candidatus Limnocylindria bacterium]